MLGVVEQYRRGVFPFRDAKKIGTSREGISYFQVQAYLPHDFSHWVFSNYQYFLVTEQHIPADKQAPNQQGMAWLYLYLPGTCTMQMT